jgi:hypothetical protein
MASRPEMRHRLWSKSTIVAVGGTTAIGDAGGSVTATATVQASICTSVVADIAATGIIIAVKR